MIEELVRGEWDQPAADRLAELQRLCLEHAEVLESLIDGNKEDELGGVLSPIASFLRDLSLPGTVVPARMACR